VQGTGEQPWRDTMLRMSGGAVYGLQRAFLLDWYFVDRTLITDRVYYPPLSTLNAQLSDLNSQLRDANLKLNESNRVKDEYVGRFIHLCSFYIDRLDEMRKRVNKMVKSHDLDALVRFTGDSALRDNNLNELYEMFDTTFLHLFPNFVDDFNALLRPECRITPPAPGTLNTDLRIFALIRLGIEDSSRIAEFLHYSVNTIYNYRAKIKNGSIADRDTFESRVKSLGM